MTERVKKQVTAVKIPADTNEASRDLLELGLHQRERVRIQAAMNDEISKIKARYEEQAQPHNEAIARLLDGLHLFAEQNKEALLTGKLKTIQLTTGTIGWRTGTPKVSIKGVDSVMERIKAMNLDNLFIRTKEEINKEAMLENRDAAMSIPGVTITQQESFWAKPYETQLEEIAT
jgi:phage host-nuclease inhibitor protein Gam